MQSKSYEINSKKVISETLEGETIIINLENGSYFSMNNTGTVIWNAINKGQIIPTDIAEVAHFINFLEQENLIIENKTPTNTSTIDLKDFTNPKIEKYEDMQEMLLADPVHDVDEMGWPKLKEDK